MSTTLGPEAPRLDPETPEAIAPAKLRGLKSITAGASVVPLAVLFTLNFVDEFDQIAFNALAPEIRNAFGLTDAGITNLRGITGILTLLAALPLGVLADRVNRVKVSIAAAVLWGVASVLTGVVGAIFLLYLVRLGSGLGRIINEVVHPSLLADYYEPKAHPRVFGVHRLANSLGALAGPIAGLVAGALNYRAAFFLLAIPTVISLLFGVSRLREPKRGASIDPGLAEAVDDEAVGFAESRRQIFAVPTMKRFYIGAFFFGLGTFQLGTLLSLYFDREYAFGPEARGFVQALYGAGTVAGLLIGSRLASQASLTSRIDRLPLVVGGAFAPFAAGMVLLSVAPFVGIALLATFVLSAGVGMYQPAYYSVVGSVAPPKVRSQAYAYAILVYGLGGLTYLVVFGIFGGEESANYRGLALTLGLVTSIAGFVAASARTSVEKDYEQAALSMAAGAALRDALAAGGTDRPLLICKDVDVKYDTVQILFGVDVEVKENEIVALLGTNGAGKSTLLKAISGLVDPVGGAIFFDGRDITHADAVQTARAGIVQVPGGKAVFPTLTVEEHFKAGTWLFANEDPAVVRARVDEVLERFPRLQERWDQLAGNLSGGEQQQLALGMAFVAKPKLLIIDELSLGLAPTIVELLLKMVRAIHAQGCTIILVEQSVNVALTIASRAYFLEKGEVRFSGPTAELLKRGDILRSVFLEGAGSVQDGGAGSPKRSERAAGRDAEGHVLPATFLKPDGTPSSVGEPVMEVMGLTKRFGGIRAVDDVTFSLQPGEILGLIGPNGAGKTTIFDLLSGLISLDSGRISFRGVDVTGWSPDKRATLGLGRSFQDARIFPSLTVAENVALGLERHIECRDHLAGLLGLPAMQQSEEDVAYTVEDLIDLMSLGAYRDKFVAELSTGSRRIVDLAMAIAHDPTVLILDEPSSGIAQRETEALGPLLKRIQREAGCAMLIIEHDMPLITGVSDRMIALELGAVMCEGTPDEVISDPQVVSSYLGGDIDVINRSGNSAAAATIATKVTTAARRSPLKAAGR
ncbi:MAG: MFS transporter [Acidimicrobiales bacterium]